MMLTGKNTLVRIDWLTVILFVLLTGFGWLNLFSATYDEGLPVSLFSFASRYSKQFYYILAALVIAFLVMITDGKVWGAFAYLVYGLTVGLSILVLFIGREINGARSWIILGPVSFQPAEFMKAGMALLLAKLLSRFDFKIHRLHNLFLILLFTGLPMVLVFFQNDTGTMLVFLALILVLFREGLSGYVLIFGGIAAALFFLTLVFPLSVFLPVITIIALLLTWLYQHNFKYFLWGVISFSLLFGTVFLVNRMTSSGWSYSRVFFVASLSAFFLWAILIYRYRLNSLYLFLFAWIGATLLIFSVDMVFHDLLEPHQQARISQLLGLVHDPLGTGYNLNQSKIAIGSGGFFGKGFLRGTQTRFNFVPEQSTDFIFSTVGEEWGFLGSLLVIGSFSGLLIRLIFLAERQRSVFSRVFGYSVVSILFFHFAVNIGMVIGLVPVIGIPLPFFSYGGSSLLTFTLLLFIMLRLDTSRYEVIN
ncbi:MAG: rod shape-determining protein RodA [Bacteroidales bacterium]|nr:rod shape-determining protein RodA [Bacteroidales bacterium]